MSSAHEWRRRCLERVVARAGHRWFVAGGGREGEFDERWERRLAEGRATRQALREDRLDTAGGHIH